MGHLTPFLRIASMLLSNNCMVIYSQPIQQCLLQNPLTLPCSFPPIHNLSISSINYQITPSHHSNSTTDDPFFLQFAAISRHVHLLYPFLSSASPSFSAIFSDFSLPSSITQVAADLAIPNYIVSATSVKFFSLMAYLPILTSYFRACLTCIPTPFFDPNHLFTALIVSNAPAFSEAKGIIINTFDWFEPETLAVVNSGKALSNPLPILPIGPLEPYELSKDQFQSLPWLDNQPEESVVYVSFGSRTAMSKDQIRELADGLERNGCRFLWVIKSSKVDKEDNQELEDLLGKILAHPATGGFIKHCGWNSVMEAVSRGMPLLAWRKHGEQRVNAEAVANAGLGIWARDWGWGVELLVKGEEIERKIGELMKDKKLIKRPGRLEGLV
ncbi:hypothetical protein ACJW30_01G256200, partial [Castanea mollissima]